MLEHFIQDSSKLFKFFETLNFKLKVEMQLHSCNIKQRQFNMAVETQLAFCCNYVICYGRLNA